MNLEDIKGLGPVNIQKLKKLNILNIYDLQNYYPYKYNILIPDKLNDQEEILKLNAIIIDYPKINYIRKNLTKLTITVIVENQSLKVTIFNRHFLKDKLYPNKSIFIIGKYNKLTNSFLANDIILENINNVKIEPKYHLIESLKNNQIHNYILESLKFTIKDELPNEYVEKYKLINNKVSLEYIHNPQTEKQIVEAKKRIIYEELFDYMFKINYIKNKIIQSEKNIIKKVNEKDIQMFIKKLPFNLTVDQLNAVKEIEKDFESNKRMNRLILGDVGSGKTIVAIIALYMNQKSGFQGAFMVPTEVLAEQHYKECLKYFKEDQIKLLTGSTSKKNKTNILNNLKEGTIDIIIGTHSLIEESVEFKNLGLVITDEQHRFGVNQRKNLQNKGELVDVIYMSATPIPRTLALTIYGDMEISEIKTKPSGRKPIITKLYKYKELKEVLNACLEELKLNHQVYVVCPLIEGQNENSVENLKEKFELAFQNKVKIETLHGKKNSKEKEEIINNFKKNLTKILISTTVIEVGIDVKNATTMIIFDAERFGLATLHQLRGRVGRNDIQSYCYLISDKETERLKVLEQSNDGFYISEKDFELRGSGDIFGTNQSGEKLFKMANLKEDYKFLKCANEDSLEFLKNNKDNKFDKYPKYKSIINKLEFID